MKQVELIITADSHCINASYVEPDKEKPKTIVLFIGGSGPIDKNENTKTVFLNTFNQLAVHFAKQNIGSVRYDKRGCGKSSGDYMSCGLYDLLADAKCVLEYILEKYSSEQTKIVLLGHSEGAIIASMLSNEYADELEGLILICPYIIPLRELIHNQQLQTIKEIKELRPYFFVIFRILQFIGKALGYDGESLIKKVHKSTREVITFGFKKINAKWLRESLNVNLNDIYANVKVPTLIICGGKDLQCPPTDGGSIAALIQHSTQLIMLDNMNHILRDETNSPYLSNYSKLIKHKLSPQLVKEVLYWLC